MKFIKISIMNPLDVMLLFNPTSQEYLVIYFVYLQLGCATSNFRPLPRGSSHSTYANNILLNVPTRKISAINRVYLGILLRFAWSGYTQCTTMVGVEGKKLDLGSFRSLQSTLPDENYSTKKSWKSSNRFAFFRLPPLQIMKFTLILA